MTNKNQGIVAVFEVDDTLIDSGAKLKADVVSALSRLGCAISPEQVVGNWYTLLESYGISREQFEELKKLNKYNEERKTIIKEVSNVASVGRF